MIVQTYDRMAAVNRSNKDHIGQQALYHTTLQTSISEDSGEGLFTYT